MYQNYPLAFRFLFSVDNESWPANPTEALRELLNGLEKSWT